jgi:flagellar basal-body rod modification protein FlgD
MSTTPATTAAAGATTQTQTQSGTTSAQNAKGMLDKDGFLKLFIAQLTHQDPSSPMDTNESVAQMASFTMVEQITTMTSSNAQIAKTLTTSNAVGLIGRTVTYIDADGETLKTGKVERVSTTADGVSTLTVDGAPGINPTSITSVA